MDSERSFKSSKKPLSASKNLPWFQAKIGYSLTSDGRRLLEEYSHIEPCEIENHVYQIRETAWEIYPWPCVGEFLFITLLLSQHPSYGSLLSRLQPPSSPFKLLDLGTCLGSDLRKLVCDGASLQNLYGADVFAQYERIGHALFRDADIFKGRFLAADLFDNSDNSELVRSEGTWDIITASMFLHIFDWKTQVQACKRIVQLLSRKPGSILMGVQTGSTTPGELVLRPPFAVEGENKTMFRHNFDTFREMWKIVGIEECIKLDVEVTYDEEKDYEVQCRAEEAGEKTKFLSGIERKILYFVVTIC